MAGYGGSPVGINKTACFIVFNSPAGKRPPREERVRFFSLLYKNQYPKISCALSRCCQSFCLLPSGCLALCECVKLLLDHAIACVSASMIDCASLCPSTADLTFCCSPLHHVWVCPRSPNLSLCRFSPNSQDSALLQSVDITLFH